MKPVSEPTPLTKEQKLESLKKVTTELADNLELAHGVRTCKVCGHTPEVLYKEVEKLVDQAILQERNRIVEIVEKQKFKHEAPGFTNALEIGYKDACDYILKALENNES